MKSTAIATLKTKLSHESRCHVLVGNNNWLLRQLRSHFEDTFGKQTTIEYVDETSLRNVAATVNAKTLFGPPTRLIWVRQVDFDKLKSWLTHLDLYPTGICLVVEILVKKDDGRIYQGQMKNLDEFEQNPTIIVTDIRNPPEDIAKQVIARIIHPLPDRAVIRLFQEFGADFDICEQIAAKIKEGQKFEDAFTECKEIGIRDIWLFVDAWIDGNYGKALGLLSRIETSSLNAYAVSNQMAREFRQHVLAKEGSRAHYSVVERAKLRQSTWLTSTYHSLTAISPLDKTFYEQLRYLAMASFIPLS